MSRPARQRVELPDLARAVLAMRKAQRAYFAARKAQPHVTHTAELNTARDLEARVDQLVADALARERVDLPGFGADEGRRMT